MKMVLALITSFTIAFFFTYITTPVLIDKFRKLGLLCRDIHKFNPTWVPTSGGLIILFGYALAVSTTLLIFPTIFPTEKLSFAILTAVLIGLLGGIDDLRPIRQRYKFLLPAIFSYPLIIASHGQSTSITIPLIGSLEFGQLYWFVLIPLAITTASNLTNMLAGFNGLEAGVGFIACSAISVAAVILNKLEVVIIILPLAAALIAFLYYNWYPAKIFPGNSGTLLIGATIASAAIIGKIEFICVILMIPYAIDFTLKMMVRRPFAGRYIYGDTKVREDGILTPPQYPALAHAFLISGSLNEKQLVQRILTLEVVYAMIAILFAILR
ncbi:MAG: hypothetical protein HY929_01375 [Euryarchaeota archaeon]|nr:hypothetical protein [Euryarchaeota archaeon]